MEESDEDEEGFKRLVFACCGEDAGGAPLVFDFFLLKNASDGRGAPPVVVVVDCSGEGEPLGELLLLVFAVTVETPL